MSWSAVATFGIEGRDLQAKQSRLTSPQLTSSDIRRRDSHHPKTRPAPSKDATSDIRRRDPHRYRSRPIATQDAYKQKGSRVQETNRLHQTKVATPAYNIKSTTPPLCRPQSQRKQITTCSTISSNTSRRCWNYITTLLAQHRDADTPPSRPFFAIIATPFRTSFNSSGKEFNI